MQRGVEYENNVEKAVFLFENKNKDNEKTLSQTIAWLLQLGMLDKTERKAFFYSHAV